MLVGISKPATLVAVVLLIGVIIMVSPLLVSMQKGITTSTTVSPTTTVAAATSDAEAASNSSIAVTTTSVNPPCVAGAQTMAVSGTEFCSVEVTNDTVLGNPGYSYFKNGSISFMGVTFQTICPPGGMGCPGVTSRTATMFSGEMRFTMTFPDHTNETAWGITGVDPYVPILSVHSNPKAGMLIEDEGYDAQMGEEIVHVFLLVEEP